ncbi:MAG: hypothetical protein HN337_08570 [Deltaproteobacteria bacterium]|nr:hypothetical protein [Deltaproteobacteria bacterium]
MAKSPENFSESGGYKKIDLRLREAWKTSMKDGDGNRTLQCIMKTRSRISDSEQKQLKSSGYKFRTIIGRIITGTLKAKDLPTVANLDFVIAMELSTPMSLKGGGKEKVKSRKTK